jgi:phosphatidylglycerophosphatase B
MDPQTLVRRFALVIAVAYAGVLASFTLPEIPLDGWLGVLAVRLSDTGSWEQLPFVAIAMLIVIVSRPGLETRRRVLEAGAIGLTLALLLAGNAELNEHVIKPAFAIPRPNLAALADSGALGLGVDEFYALGDKQARREWLGPRVDALTEPALHPLVREHWLIETGYSFPSGHATASMTFASLMVAIGLRWTWGWRRTLVMLLPCWAVLVACTRPLLRVHTYIDVTAGAAIGIFLGMTGFAVLHLLFNRGFRG